MAASPDLPSHDDASHDDFDERLLDTVGEQVAVLHDVADDELAGQLRAIVQDTLCLRRPDGTWPPAELLAEVLRSYLDVLDERHPRDAAGAAWVEAWREAVDSPTLLERLLDELRATRDEAERNAKVPGYPPPDDLTQVIEP